MKNAKRNAMSLLLQKMKWKHTWISFTRNEKLTRSMPMLFLASVLLQRRKMVDSEERRGMNRIRKWYYRIMRGWISATISPLNTLWSIKGTIGPRLAEAEGIEAVVVIVVTEAIEGVAVGAVVEGDMMAMKQMEQHLKLLEISAILFEVKNPMKRNSPWSSNSLTNL